MVELTETLKIKIMAYKTQPTTTGKKKATDGPKKERMVQQPMMQPSPKMERPKLKNKQIKPKRPVNKKRPPEPKKPFAKEGSKVKSPKTEKI